MIWVWHIGEGIDIYVRDDMWDILGLDVSDIDCVCADDDSDDDSDTV